MKKWITLGNKALTQENNTLRVKWLIILLPVFQRLQNQGNSSKNPLRGLVHTWIWNLGLSKQEIVKQNNYPFICTGTWLEKMKGEKQGLEWQKIDMYVCIFSADAQANWTVWTGLCPTTALSCQNHQQLSMLHQPNKDMVLSLAIGMTNFFIFALNSDCKSKPVSVNSSLNVMLRL